MSGTNIEHDLSRTFEVKAEEMGCFNVIVFRVSIGMPRGRTRGFGMRSLQDASGIIPAMVRWGTEHGWNV